MQLGSKVSGNEDMVVERVARLEDYLGQPLDFVTAFLDSREWNTWLSAKYFVSRYARANRPVLWSWPLGPTGDDKPNPLPDIISGKRDAVITENAKALAAFRLQDREIRVRIGWEGGGKDYAWAIGAKQGATPAEYAAAVKRTAGLIRAQSERFRFCLSLSVLTGSEAAIQSMWPGDEVVDYVTADTYWFKQWQSSDPAIAWQMVRDRPVGLNWIYDLAQRRKKKFAIDELGIETNGGPFVHGLADWIDKRDVSYVGYWDSDSSYKGSISGRDSGDTGPTIRERFVPQVVVREQREELSKIGVALLESQQRVDALHEEVDAANRRITAAKTALG